MSNFKDKKNKALVRVKTDIANHQKELEKIEKHTEQDCKDGKHITRGSATGWGSRGEWLTTCLVCDWHSLGYD